MPSFQSFEPEKIPPHEGPRRIGYLRCSTPSQDMSRQENGMCEHCDALYTEYVSGGSKKRPIFDAVIAGLQSGDTLVVWDFDRAFRSSADAIITADRLQERGIHFKVIGLNLDTSTAEGEMFYTILAAFSQYERRMISRRTKEGMEAARRAGKQIGRPRKLSAKIAREAWDWIDETGLPTRYVAALLSISRCTLERAQSSPRKRQEGRVKDKRAA